MSNKRIAANATATYLQMLLSVILGVFSIRWVYVALGKENYGLFAAVGAVLGFVGIFNSVMNHSDSRFFALAIGEERKRGSKHINEELNAWFNTAFSIHLAFAFILCVAMFFAGEALIRGGTMIVPDGLEQDSVRVFRISLLVMFLTILHMPFNALYTAKQLIFVRNLTGMLQTALVAAEAWWVLHFAGNRFVGHAVALSIVTILTYGILVGLAVRSFPECKLRISLWFDRKRIRELATYSAYAFIDAVGGCLHGSGFNLVINANFGPAANAVIGIGAKISGKLSGLSAAVSSAIAPEIASRVGATERNRAERLAILSCFLATIPVCLLGIPAVFWMKDILRVFLVSPPAGSAVVITFLVANSLLAHSSSGLQMLVLASGKVRGLQISSAVLKSCSMLLLWLLLKSGVPFLASVGFAWLVPQVAICASRIWFARKIAQVNLGNYLRLSFLPMITCTSVSLLVAGLFRTVTTDSFWWLFPCGVLNAILMMTLVARFHPDKSVRNLPKRILAKALPRVFTS